MKWVDLTAVEQLEEIDRLSEQSAVLIFKHSTRCVISSMAYSRMKGGEQSQSLGSTPVFYLDLLKFRNLSGAIADKYGVEHQSPQILVIENKKCVYDTSHNGIRIPALEEVIA